MYSTVLVTVPGSDTANRISREVLNKRLAACANVFPISSLYWWEGEVVEDEECAILFKIETGGFKDLEQEIVSVHPYETPCIVRYDISEGHKPYLDWITSSTR